MLSSKTKTGLSETLPNKTAPATPRVSKIAKAPARSDSNSPSSLQNSRLSIDHSPRSVDSKPTAERRLSKGSTPPDKLHRPLKPSELQAQLSAAQDDLKKAKERLVSVERDKDRAIEELKEAKRLADEASEKLSEAVVAQKRAEESSEIEKFRADELEQAGIEAAQKREGEWQKEVDAVRNQHAVDVAALLSATQELQRVKQELSMTSEAKNAALSHADDAMKIAEINAEKAEVLSAEVSRLKASLDSMLETKSNEAAELVKKLHSDIDLLKEELERAKKAEERLAEMEALIEGLKVEVIDSERAASDANTLVDELKKKAEFLESQIEEATQSERSALESLASLKKQLEMNNASLQEAESEIASLRENVESLEISLGRHKVDLEESDRRLEMAKQEAMEMTKTVENLKSELQSAKEDKAQAQNNEMLALSSVQTLLDEKNKLIDELEASKDEEEKSKNAMESLASALHEVSMEARDAKEKLTTNQAELGNAESQVEELKSVLEATKDKYEPMLDKMKEEMGRLEQLAEKYQTESKTLKAKFDEKELDFMTAIKKSDEELDAAKREMDMLAENSKAEWHEKELGFMASIKESEHEIIALKEQLDRLLNLLKETEEEAQSAKEDGEQLQITLKQAKSEANSAKEAAEKAKADNLQLNERLLDKENELQSITQENDDLRTREAAALEKVEELSRLLAEASAKKTEENSELSNSEKSYDLLPKMVGLVEEDVDESDEEKPKPEHTTEQLGEHGGGEDLSRSVDVVEQNTKNGNGNAENEEDSVDAEVKMWDNCKIADKDLSPERELEPESFEDESESKIDGDTFDLMNGSASETVDGSGSSPSKQHHKKKTPLLRKFGSLLKKKSNPK
eukprot:TRINITY_DN3455_c0_g1_i6.p1 TRINITY_DN3455_c0_g1~~TRINITY_DN3455_c0_g1_i6.p1  ORF type:complete len:864 (-),score=302.51 TRINITY_DN3455_c0_g1_i6:290-2881(-)